MNEIKSDKKPAEPKRNAPPSLGNPDQRAPTIGVRLVEFINALNVPGDSAASKINCAKPSHIGARHWTCELIPSLRTFEITYYPPGEALGERAYIPESQVKTWFPKGE